MQISDRKCLIYYFVLRFYSKLGISSPNFYIFFEKKIRTRKKYFDALSFLRRHLSQQ